MPKSKLKDKRAYDLMVNARSVLLLEHAFFGCLIMHLKLVEMYGIGTMATDGSHLFYEPQFVHRISERERIGVIAHEGSHCAYRHHIRLGDRDPEDWNTAADYIINLDLVPYFTLPKIALLDKQYRGMSSEEVYTLIHKKKPPQGGGQSDGQDEGKSGRQKPGKGQNNGQQDGDGNGGGKQGQIKVSDPGGCGGVIAPCSSWDKNTIEKEKTKWETIAKQAINVAKKQNAGKIPGYLERLVEDLEKPNIDLESIVRRFADNSISKDYTWASPNRRFLHYGLILPGLVSDKVHHGICVMDTSGSIDNETLGKYSAIVRALLDEGLVDKLTVLYNDTQVQRTEEFERGDIVTLNPKGGGGTSFKNVFEEITQKHSDVTFIIFLTDLLVRDFGEDPGLPVLWLVYGDPRISKALTKKIPFGEEYYIGQ